MEANVPQETPLDRFSPGPSIRIPKVAELVAQTLRRRIVLGEYQPGELLPPEGELMGIFDVARTTIRDAFRVLESEGLLEVRRGGGGGARVRAPGVGFVSSYAALLLQYEQATLEDVHDCRIHIEGPAAAMLAERSDDESVLKALQRALADEEEVAGDDSALAVAEGRFHKLVVDLIDNRVLSLLSAMVNRLIAEQVERNRDRAAGHTSAKGYRDAHRAHVQLVALVAAGNADGAEQHWRRHLRSASEQLAQGPRAAHNVLDLFP